LYGEAVDVTFVERLRPEKRFSGLDELKDQIARDVEEARRIVGEGA
jgi:riboflavin kinase/FMN adenylyltransferase